MSSQGTRREENKEQPRLTAARGPRATGDAAGRASLPLELPARAGQEVGLLAPNDVASCEPVGPQDSTASCKSSPTTTCCTPRAPTFGTARPR
jgi:hypothetical protein